MGDQLLCFKMLLLQSAVMALALMVFVSAAVQDPEILVEEEIGSVTIQKDLVILDLIIFLLSETNKCCQNSNFLLLPN